jgi:ribosomal protein S18 acetylase RimI-like enzyme
MLGAMEPTIRRGRPGDAAAVAGFTAGTFSWGDYVADEFPGWLNQDESRVLVAADDGDRAVGLARVVMLSPMECWLHAARVHPDLRRRGIGGRLNDACVEWAGSRGARVARLMVEEWNEAAQGQVTKLGYRPVAKFAHGERSIGSPEPSPEGNGWRRVPGDEQLQPADLSEAEPAYQAWSASDLIRTAHGLFPIGWSWRAMDISDVRAAARRRSLLESPSGWAIADREGADLHVSWAVTGEDDAAALATSLLDRAFQARVSRLTAMIPAVPWLLSALERARLKLTRSLVFEKVL